MLARCYEALRQQPNRKRGGGLYDWLGMKRDYSHLAYYVQLCADLTLVVEPALQGEGIIFCPSTGHSSLSNHCGSLGVHTTRPKYRARDCNVIATILITCILSSVDGLPALQVGRSSVRSLCLGPCWAGRRPPPAHRDTGTSGGRVSIGSNGRESNGIKATRHTPVLRVRGGQDVTAYENLYRMPSVVTWHSPPHPPPASQRGFDGGGFATSGVEDGCPTPPPEALPQWWRAWSRAVKDQPLPGRGVGSHIPGVLQTGTVKGASHHTLPSPGSSSEKPFKMSVAMRTFAGIDQQQAAQGEGLVEGCALQAHRIVIDDLLASVGPSRAFPVLMFLTALPNCIPGPPMLNFVFGIPMIFICLQYAVGVPRPWLPRFIASMNLSRTFVTTVVRAVLPVVTRIESNTHPRFGALQKSPVYQRLLGVFLVSLACALTMPVPFTTQPASIALAITVLGMAEGDGGCVAAGVGMGLAAEVLLYYIVKLFWFVGKKAAEKLSGGDS